MKTLLQPGDRIRIREDIKHGEYYNMIYDKNVRDCYLSNEMFQPGELVEIALITNGKYKIVSAEQFDVDYLNGLSFYTYTDEMFDLETIELLLLERDE